MVEARDKGGATLTTSVADTVSSMVRLDAVIIGGSAGSMPPLLALLSALPADFPVPIFVVLHLHRSDGGAMAEHLNSRLALPVREATDKCPIVAPGVYTAPADYHLLIERNPRKAASSFGQTPGEASAPLLANQSSAEGKMQSYSFALSIDPRVNWSRPSIDVAFESAARVYGEHLLAILLSGANEDGAQGMRWVRALGGVAIVQPPESAESPVMPRSAIDIAGVTLLRHAHELSEILLRLSPSTPHLEVALTSGNDDAQA
ncbi:MAG: chemotaxis protein CheB [Myxococcota bacterium]|jgi:two-component system chemotaxis response regulator CheB|nr:chemotaxis protein CheB [Myxococcota bacterium]